MAYRYGQVAAGSTEYGPDVKSGFGQAEALGESGERRNTAWRLMFSFARRAQDVPPISASTTKVDLDHVKMEDR